MMRPSGRPPPPSGRSMASEPVERVSTFILVLLPRRMIEPSPNCFVMDERASSMFLSRVCATGAGAGDFVSAALTGEALDMALRGDPVDAFILKRRDSKIPNHTRFLAAPGGPKEPQGEAAPARKLAKDSH